MKACEWMTLVVVASLNLLGCAVNTRAEILVKDPRAVAVVMDTPSGSRTLLPAGVDPASAPLPQSSPPYESNNRVAVAVVREMDGAIAVRCDSCTGSEHLVYVGPDGRAELSNLKQDDIQWRPDANHGPSLSWSVDVQRWNLNGASLGTRTVVTSEPETITTLRFVTPATNVVSVRVAK
jgi:hypothetical protein